MLVHQSIIQKEYQEYFDICQRFIHKIVVIDNQSWPSLILALKVNPNLNLSIANDLRIKIVSSITPVMIKGLLQNEIFLNYETFRELLLKAIENSKNHIGLEVLYRILDSPVLVKNLEKINEDSKLKIIQVIGKSYQLDSGIRDPKLIEKRLITYIGIISGLQSSIIKMAKAEFFADCMNIVSLMLNDYHKNMIGASKNIIYSFSNKMDIESDSEEEKFFDAKTKKQNNYRNVIKNVFEEKPEMHLNITNNQLIYLIEFIKFGFDIALRDKYEKLTEFIYLACNNLLLFLILVKQDTKNFLKTTLAFKYNYHMIPYYLIIQQQKSIFSSVLNDSERWTSILKIFSKLWFHKLAISDDEEFLNNNEFIQNQPNQNNISAKEMVALAEFLNKFVFEIIWNRRLDFETTKKSCVKLLKELYARDTRIKYCPKEFWHIPELKSMYLKIIASPTHFKNDVCFSILELVPHMIPFEIRLQIFRKLIESDQENQDRYPNFNGNDHNEDESNSKKIRIRRDYILEDGFQKIYKRKDMRSMIVIKFVNEHGMEEDGIDGGGLFKEFITLLSK